MTGPIIRDAALLVRDGCIAAVGPIALMRRGHPAAAVCDLGNAAVLPGLVNAHTHLELSSIQRGKPPARFVDWILDLMSRVGAVDPAGATAAGIVQCLRFGVTTVGDITSQPAMTRPILAQSPVGGVSFGEVRAMGQRRTFLEPRLASSIEKIEGIEAGISPHAPYSIEMGGYVRCLAAAREGGLPLATHLAETPDEAMFLADHAGPFKELWDFLAAWDDGVPEFSGGPIRFASAIGLLDYPTLLAHVNYCDDSELDLLAAGKASVVYCPRTHEFFGHRPHRWREMSERGINVAAGTDSCASSPDLNLVDELRLLHRLAPFVDPLELWQMATVRGARALGLSNVGSLSVGHRADLVVFPTTGDDPLREIIERSVLPRQVWVAGRVVPQNTEST